MEMGTEEGDPARRSSEEGGRRRLLLCGSTPSLPSKSCVPRMRGRQAELRLGPRSSDDRAAAGRAEFRRRRGGGGQAVAGWRWSGWYEKRENPGMRVLGLATSKWV